MTDTTALEMPVECWKCGAIGTSSCTLQGCPLPSYPPMNRDVEASRDGRAWYRPLLEPFYWGLLPWAWRRITGWKDEFGRPAQFIGWKG